MSKLDPALLGVVARRQEHQRRARQAFAASAEPGVENRPSPSPRPTPDVVQILVKFTGDVDDLRSAGFQPRSQRRHPTEGWTIASGSIPVDRVTELAATVRRRRAEILELDLTSILPVLAGAAARPAA